MKAVKSENTGIERKLADEFRRLGIDFTANDRGVCGNPDFVFPDSKTAVFCDSEFWHGFDWEIAKKEIHSNREFWIQKIEENIGRDVEVGKKLSKEGWKVIRFWGSEIESDAPRCAREAIEVAKGAKVTGEEYNFHFVPFTAPEDPVFTFVDLFSGIGGFRLALQNLGGRCVFSSEIDKFARKTYAVNFGEFPAGDITKISASSVPDHDLLAAGFPCQAFSIAGKRGGFEDTRGTLFFEIARILMEKKPKAFILENVKGLLNHDHGRTIKTILNVLRNDLGYFVPEPKINNAMWFDLPQNRDRLIIVGFREDVQSFGFSWPITAKTNKTIKDITEEKPVSPKYYLSETYLNSLKRHRERQEKMGNGFGYEIKGLCDTANTIVIGGMGKERNLLIDQRLKDLTPVTKIRGKINSDFVRRMTPGEWARLQGFPENFIIPVSDTQAYKQFANAVPVPMIGAIAKNVMKILGVKLEPQI